MNKTGFSSGSTSFKTKSALATLSAFLVSFLKLATLKEPQEIYLSTSLFKE
jgi:hypothetical protein